MNLRKPLDQLTDRNQIASRMGEIQQLLGPGYKIVKSDELTDATIDDLRSFRRFHRLTDRTVIALAKIPGSKWPPISHLNRSEAELVATCGGFTTEIHNGIEMIWASNPALMFFNYLQGLNETAWKGNVPEEIKLVISGDKG